MFRNDSARIPLSSSVLMSLLRCQIIALQLLVVVSLNVPQKLNLDIEQLKTGKYYEEPWIVMPSWKHQIISQSEGSYVIRNFDLMSIGATGDGVTDDTQAFTDAWAAACSVDHAKLIVPSNRRFLVGPISFSGPCATNLSLNVEGIIIAPQSLSYWSGLNAHRWLEFRLLDGFTLEGNGTIDGQGQEWWAQSCKVNRSNAVTISNSNNSRIRNLTFKNSQNVHLAFVACTNVHASDLLVTAPETSPNTDGINIRGSSDVLINDCTIRTGDDCISIVTDTFHTMIRNLKCGPGHGISIGSLGKDGSFANVSDIVVDGATLNRSTNGVRIKTWQGGQGAANNISFQNMQMIDVANPIIIDQYYCNSTRRCQNQTSAVEVSGINYKNITGTSSTTIAVKFACSKTVPCHDIVLENVNLTLYKSHKPAFSFCWDAKGSTRGVINPKSCLAKS
ncbi:hypothetical protein O6H91_04G029400 [Diphasiastrum complanatum]|uniref:Uncharacterized protein n=2 Tax=Diphasiastrum complanatum TaxID=34168 RepID=A0ACC2DVH6_DIPCM|nr:hypothetical protein O6H91_04G029400 [Diphasiastrum complanatum]KAJ7558229.1 hypothetical protein O6H91_04G029400 [Diphasiastrum complanatum]